MISVGDATEVFNTLRDNLALPRRVGGDIDDTLLACALRRLAGFSCPASASTLSTKLIGSFAGLVENPEAFRDRVDDMVAQLVVQGDLLELSQVAATETDKSTTLYAGRPCFVVRPGGEAILLGITADELSPLPASMATRIRYEGPRRTIEPESGEDISAALRALGLPQLTEDTWLKSPSKDTADGYVEKMNARLAGLSRSVRIEEVEVYDRSAHASYKKRWQLPGGRTGRFVARRPQSYGAAIWGYADVEAGVVRRFLDFPLSGAQFRGCDAAWRLQMAIEAATGSAQTYRVTGNIFDFYFPLPTWAERRLSVLGARRSERQSLCSFEFAEKDCPHIESFLTDWLWLARDSAAPATDDADG